MWNIEGYQVGYTQAVGWHVSQDNEVIGIFGTVQDALEAARRNASRDG